MWKISLIVLVFRRPPFYLINKMETGLIKTEIAVPEIPENWSYEDSIKKIKAFVYKWKNLTFEILRELWIAREILSLDSSKQPRQADGTFVPTDNTWEKYCQEIDIEKRTANRWLRKYFSSGEQLQIQAPELPQGKYFILYADPPWQYQNIGFDESAEQQYPTMSVEEICTLPIHNLITDRAVLFLWVTNAFINEGLKVCEAWGFEYKTNFAWIKSSGPSIGWFIKSRHELLFIATKGEGLHPSEKFISWFEFKVRRHSQKPDIVYEMVEKMYPGPYMELFARQSRDGWDSWGNELQ